MRKNGDHEDASESARPVRRSDVTVQELDGEALIYDPVTADTHRLNRTAYLIWQSCDGRLAPADLAVRLIEVYDVERQEALQHAQRMVGELIQQGQVKATARAKFMEQPSLSQSPSLG